MAFRDGFRTDDLGRLTADGRLQILGRADEVIVTGGKKVHPQQVETLLCAHHSVAEALVVGVADAEWGQRVVAAVVPSDPRRPPTLATLRRHVAASAPGWTRPKELRLISDLPRLASGKVDRRAAAELLRSLNTADDGLAGMQQLAGDATLVYSLSAEAQEGHDACLARHEPDFSGIPWRRP